MGRSFIAPSLKQGSATTTTSPMPNDSEYLPPPRTKFHLPLPDCVALLCLGLIVIALHHSALLGSWRWDDGMHLLHMTQYSWTSIFFDPEVMRSVSGNQFAPWNIFLYYINHALFGSDVLWYYAHHLFSLWLAAAGLYLLARQWVSAPRAALAPALLLVGVPTSQMAQQLMTGHYIDGLVFATFGLVCQLRAVNTFQTAHRKALVLSIAGALLYGGACLCKEVYVPWILLWLVVPWVFAPAKRCVAICAAPALLVALAYTVARTQIFGSGGGYYGGDVSNWEVTDIARSLASILRVLLGDGMHALAGVALICMALFAGVRKSYAWGAVCVSAVLVTLLPLVVLAASDPPWALHARYLWAPWILGSLIWTAPWEGVLRPIQWFACLLFATLAICQMTTLRPDDQRREAMFDAHSRMVLQPISEVTHWAPAEFNGASYMSFVTYATHEALRRLGHITSHPPKVLRSVPDDPVQQATAQAWDASCHCFRALLALTEAERKALLVKTKSEKGLLLPGIYPLADAYVGPTPEMRVEGNQLHISGTAPSEGAGHVLILGGWAPSRLVTSNVTVHAPAGNSAAKHVRFEIVLEGRDVTAVHQTRDRLCILMQSQTHPYTFLALDAAAPYTACRALLTPLGLRQPLPGGMS